MTINPSTKAKKELNIRWWFKKYIDETGRVPPIMGILVTPNELDYAKKHAREEKEYPSDILQYIIVMVKYWFSKLIK